MKNLFRIKSAFLAAFVSTMLLISPELGFAQNVGASFLQVGVGTAQMGAGGTGASYISGSHSLYWNPAGLATGDDNSATVNYMAWIGSSAVFSLSTRLNSGKNGAFGFGVETVSLGNIEARDEPGEPLGTFGADFTVISAAYAYQLGQIRLGIVSKYLAESIVEERTDGFGIDLGIQGDFLVDRLKAGVSIQNLGQIEDFSLGSLELPRIIRAGLHGKLISAISQQDKSSIAKVFGVAEIEYIQNLDVSRFHLAMIIEAFDAVTGRIGYITNSEAQRFSLGVGFKYQEFEFDFAYLPFRLGAGSAGQSVSISYDW